MDSKTNQGQFFEALARSGKAVKQSRAKAIGEETKLAYGRMLEDNAMKIRRLQSDREATLDLSPTDINSLVLAKDFDARTFADNDLDSSIKIRNLKIQLEVGMERYKLLFGEDFKLNFEVE